MTILHLEDEPWDSGLAEYALTLAAEQKRNGHRVEFWGSSGSPLLARAAALGLAARGWPSPKSLGWLFTLPSQRRAAAALAPTVINAHTGSSHSTALLLAAGRRFAVIRTRADARLPRRGFLARETTERTSAFIAANAALEQALRREFPGARVARVPQGVDGPPEAPPLPDAPTVGVLARLDPVKGHATLFDAVASLRDRLPELRLRCAGDGKLGALLAAGVAKRGLSDRVELLGRVPERSPFIASCRVGVVPSLGSEAVSRAALEWMAAGRPVIAAAVGGLPDLVEDGVTGRLVPPGDAPALAAALRELLGDAALAASWGAAGRRRWQERFSPGPFYEATQRIYDEAAARLPS